MKRVDEVRLRIEELRAEVDRIRFSPMPRSEALDRLDQWISERRRGLAAWAFSNLDDRGRPRPPMLHDNPCAVELGIVTAPSVAHLDLSGLFCSVVPEGVREAVSRSIPPDGPDTGPPLAERPGMIDALEGEILSLAIEEERLISEAEERTGETIPRRPDAPIEIIVGGAEYLAQLRQLIEGRQPCE